MKSALLVIDAQQSFLYRPYFDPSALPDFIEKTQRLINRARAANAPILQVFHVENESASNPFSFASGFVRPLAELDLEPTDVFYKSVHSAMFASNAEGQSVDYWLRKHGIERLIISGIRTEQCCETTTRHASDLGYEVTFVPDATLTFDMTHLDGTVLSAADIKRRTTAVLVDRFAAIRSVEDAIENQ